jgi:hypothetical protein
MEKNEIFHVEELEARLEMAQIAVLPTSECTSKCAI